MSIFYVTDCRTHTCTVLTKKAVTNRQGGTETTMIQNQAVDFSRVSQLENGRHVTRITPEQTTRPEVKEETKTTLDRNVKA